MTSVHVGRVTDFDALGQRWRILEQQARPSFFQTWTWVGCLVEARFDDPIVVEAIEGDTTVALALFNRRRHWSGLTTLYLHESGSPDLDCPYVEQNGVLAVAGREAELTALCLGAVTRRQRVVLSGIGPDTLIPAARRDDPLCVDIVMAAAGPPSTTLRCWSREIRGWWAHVLGLAPGIAHHDGERSSRQADGMMPAQPASGLVRIVREQPSPSVDLAAVRLRGGDFLAGCSANTRQQIRRSDRFFAQRGPIVISHAVGAADATALLQEMASLHQASWRRRGHRGSFAQPFFGQFHHALIERGLPRQEIALMRISSGGTTIGILYNFVFRRRMLAYQSGFSAYPGAQQAKPGLTCHHAAIRQAALSGIDIYDFLAGGARYKLSLADSAHPQYWAEAGPRWYPDLLARCLRDRLRAMSARPRSHASSHG